MLKEIKKFVNEYPQGLFLLNSPTGFGKTTAVINYLEEYIRGNISSDKKRMFFMTNLKINLPWNDLRLKGKSKPGYDSIKAICLALDISADRLLGLDEK